MPDVKLRFEITDGGTVRVIEDVAEKTKKVGDEAEKSASRASQAYGRLEKAAVATAAAIGAVGTAIVASVLDQSRQIDEVTKLSRSIGIAVGPLSELQVVADLSGVALSELGNSVVFFSRKMAEAESPTSKAGAIFKALGIDVRDTRGNLRDTIGVIEDVADKFALLQDGAQKTALAQELFSRSGSRMISFLNQGSEAIRGAREQARLLGITIDEETGAAAEALNDDLTRLRLVMTGVQRELATALVPVFGDMAEKAFAWVTANDQLIQQNVEGWVQRLIPAVQTLGTLMEPVIFGLRILGGDVEGPGAVMDKWREEQKKLATGVLGPEIPAWLRRSREAHQETLEMLTEEQQRINKLLDEAFAKTGATAAATGEKIATGMFDPITQGIEEYSRALKRAQGGLYGPEVAAQFEEIRAQAELVPGAINDWTDSIEQAQVAAVNLGDILSDSLVSAVDGLITRGDFNLGDVLESTGKAAMSRMVAAMIKEKLGFDATFKANFLEYLPGIASQGADAISRNFGAGLQSIASQASNTGLVVQGAATSAGLVTFTDEYGTRFTAPASQAASAASIAGGVTPSSSAAQEFRPSAGSVAGSGLMYGSLGLGIAGIAGADQTAQLFIGGGSAIGGAIGSIAGPGGALLGGIIGGLAGWLADEAFNPDPPAFVGQREDLVEAFKAAGVFPSLALSKNPPGVFYEQGALPGTRIQTPNGWYTPPPGFGTSLRPEMEAIWGLLGLPLDASNSGLLFSRASTLGLSEDYQLRELQKVAQSNTTLDQALYQLQNQYLRYAQEGKGAEFTQEDYNERLTATIRLLRDDLPEGINIASLAMSSLMDFGQQQIADIDILTAEIDRVANITRTVGGSLRSAVGSTAQSILRGDTNARASFGNQVLDAALGGLGESVISYMDKPGGPLDRLRETFANALTPDYPFDVGVDDVRSALMDTGDFFDTLNAELQRFLPLFSEFSTQIENSTGVAAQSYRDQRAGVLGIIDDLQFSRLSPSQQVAELQRRLAADRGDLAGITADDYIDPMTEREQFDRLTGRITSTAQQLFGYAGQFAGGSRQARAIEQSALAALGEVESALSLAVSSIETGDMRVTNMTVDRIIISAQTAAGLVAGGG